MSDTCPKCGAVLRAGYKSWWECLLNSFTGKFLQSDKCRIAELECIIARAKAKVDGADYREGHMRDNLTPDECRDVILGLAMENTRLRNDLRLTREGLREALRRASELEAKCQR